MFSMMRSVVVRSTQALKPGLTQRAMSVVSGPPRVRIPYWEKMTIGIAMNVIICAPIVYIMANLHNYRGTQLEE